MTNSLGDLLLYSVQSLSGVAQNHFLMIRFKSLIKVMKFIEQTPDAAYAARELRKLFAITNWALDAKKLESFFQLAGEIQFWMLAEEKGLRLKRISETETKTPDFRVEDQSEHPAHFEVKTLSVHGGWVTLAKMAEDSFSTSLNLSKQMREGKRVVTAIQEIAPHGNVPHGQEWTEMSRHLIDKATNNIKSGQYTSAPTFLVLNLMLIGSKFTGTFDLRPVAFGYPENWSVHSGVMWTTGFGSMGQLIHGQAEFEGKPGIEGLLAREGILVNSNHEDIAGVLLVVHSLEGEPNVYGLMHSTKDDHYESTNRDVLKTFRQLVGHCWNDEVDSNGFALTEH
jgi:hypothetical protein